MQEQFTERAKSALRYAEEIAKRLHQNHIGTEHILYGLAKVEDSVAGAALAANGVKVKELSELLKGYGIPTEKGISKAGYQYTPRAVSVLEESKEQAEVSKGNLAGTVHILFALLRDTENMASKILGVMDINIKKVYMDVLLAMGEDSATFKEKMNRNNRKKKKENAEMLKQYSRDMTALAREGKLDPVIGREDEIQRLIQIVSRRTKNNPCLIGEPGVGKTAIVEGLASRIVNGEVPETLRRKRILSLDLSAMVAGSKYRGEFEERIKTVLKEVMEDGNIILFMDEIHTMIGAGGAEGSIDASSILKPSLSRGEIQLIGATTITEYRKYIEKDAALERRFQTVMVEEPTVEEATRILQGIVLKYEQFHRVKITAEAIEAAVRLADRYIPDRNLPDKAIDVIDEAAAGVRLSERVVSKTCLKLQEEISAADVRIEKAIQELNFEEAGAIKAEQDVLFKKLQRARTAHEKKLIDSAVEITESDIEKVVSAWTKIPVTKLAEKESERLLKLEKILHKRVIGQQEAVEAVAKAIRRGRVGLQDPNRPIGSFLFLGPTGVGKTELSKALAEAIFGSEASLIRVDMSEYMEQHSVSKMIGSPPGYVGFEDGGQLSEKIRRNPYSVVLFDEIEKAHPDVFNILLQVLDDGHITDAKGRKVSFKNTVLIMTSNAGAQRIVEPKNLGFAGNTSEKHNYEKMKSGVMEEVKRIFKPEFINRIDDIIVFHQLNHDNMKEIVQLLTTKLSNRCKEQMDITLNVSPALKEYLVTEYSNAKMGARPLKRAVQSVIEDALAEELLSGRIQSGDKVLAGIKNKKVTFQKKEANKK